MAVFYGLKPHEGGGTPRLGEGLPPQLGRGSPLQRLTGLWVPRPHGIWTASPIPSSSTRDGRYCSLTPPPGVAHNRGWTGQSPCQFIACRPGLRAAREREKEENMLLAQVSAQASILLAVFGSRREFCGLETEPKGPNVSSGPGLGTLESQAFLSRAIAPNPSRNLLRV